VELPTDCEIVVTRTFAAPARLVFAAMSKPEHVRRWWAPRTRGEMTECTIDFRVGGAWRYAMRANGGMEVGFSGKYLEIDAPHRIVHTEIFDPFPDVVSVVTTTLVESAGTTSFTCVIRYPSKEVRDQVIATGMESGMRESYRQLDEVVRSLA
jgi:uncharacterized protein YndB with AHSA1/START domain